MTRPALAERFSVRLRNDLTPGSLLTYRVTIHGQRTTPSPPWREVLKFTQTGKLTLLVLAKAGNKTARRVWMMRLGEPVATTLTRDGQPATTELFAKALGLPPKAAQLRVFSIDATRADAMPVGGSLVQRAGVLLALDFAHWPNRLIAPDETWETPANREEIRGIWTHRYVTASGRGAKRLAKGTFTFDGALAGPFANVATITQAEGTWQWRVSKRSLESAAADVTLQYGAHERLRELSMHLTLEVEGRRRLDKNELAAATSELANFSVIANTLRDGGDVAAQELRAFLEAHPETLWRPVANDLLARAEFEQHELAEMDEDDLREAVTNLVTRWQTAALAGRTEALQPIRATFRGLVGANRAELHKLAVDEEPNMRAMAVFCVAFGSEDTDRAQVIARCGDEVARVRAWATYGLAERRDKNTPIDVLFKLLRDEDDKVRQRACMAVTGCVRRQAPSQARFFRHLLKMTLEDSSDAVRNRAAETLDALATSGDLPALIQAETQQDVPPARRQLEATIRRLGAAPRDPSD